MKVVPYLNFDGDCRQAFDFYQQVLNGHAPEYVTIDDMPMDGDAEAWKDRILHARLEFSGQEIMGCDTPPGAYSKPQSVNVSLQYDDASEAERVFNALAADGTIAMPWERVPWGAMFGMLTDRHGIPWMINCE